MSGTKPKVRRCAIYTRKSSDEGLEQDFNSLDAQREACEAYITSQRGEGWRLIRTHYDDGGLSGGTMDRPALQELLGDIRENKVDTVVVYKVDRLTRSLTDFAKIVEVFDGHEVSFVSVTQQFNTTTSMGRLTLNMLLSFAQFEREVTGERIRDKIAASKKKGMWMGGPVPLGYEPDGRTLSINDEEAATVRQVFELYLKHGNVRRVKEEADRLGLVTKVRSSSARPMRGGQPMSRGYLYKLLGNPLYVGRISHNRETYEGQHSPIIDKKTWDAVQASLAAHTRRRTRKQRITDPSPLMGKLFDESGNSLTPTHATKSGRRYRYYVSKQLINGTSAIAEDEGTWRLPAREIEGVVGEAVRILLNDRAALADAARRSGFAIERTPALVKAVSLWRGKVLDLVNRVDLAPKQLALKIDLGALDPQIELVIPYTVPAEIKRRGVEMRLVLAGASTQDLKPDPSLVKAVARARKWFNQIVAGQSRSCGGIANEEGVSDRYVSHLLPLAFLAPEIVESILSGTQPIHLTNEILTKHTNLPIDWSDQKTLLGFERSLRFSSKSNRERGRKRKFGV